MPSKRPNATNKRSAASTNATSAEITTTMISVKKLVSNAWNPNEMSDDQFAEYVAEVKHLGHLPKPIVCRPLEDGRYQIADGEHAWRAAKEVGLTTVPCEILDDADEFEAMRQTYKRNRGGDDNPVRLGQMFGKMMATRKLSIRGLARELGIPEATVRQFINYAKAADLRTRSAPDADMGTISTLSRRELEVYLQLPDDLRDRWLEAGADVEELEGLAEEHFSQVTGPISAAGLAEFAEPIITLFGQSLRYLAKLATWWVSHQRLPKVQLYLRAVARRKLPAAILDHLPCLSADRSAEILLPLANWRSILKNAAQRSDDPRGQVALVAAGVRAALTEAGVDLQSVLDPDEVEEMHLVETAPKYIRDADCLSLREKARLLSISVDVSDELVEKAKRRAVKHLQHRRAKAEEASGDGRAASEPSLGRSVDDAFTACLDTLLREQHLASEERLFRDPEKLLGAVVAGLTKSGNLSEETVGSEPAVDVLAQRLSTLDRPELVLLATLVVGNGGADAAARWLAAVNSRRKR